MKAHCIQHVPFEGPAYIDTILQDLKIPLAVTHLYDRQKLPEMSSFDILFVMGGPMSIHDEKEYPWLKKEKRFIESAVLSGKKVIGICLGAQLIADVLGASVYKSKHTEIGWFPVTKSETAELDNSMGAVIPGTFYAFHWHGETFDSPYGAVHLAGSEACENQAFIYDNRVLALQFHLETTPESIGQFTDHVAHQIDGSQYVQGLNEIKDESYITESNSLMKKVVMEIIKPA